MRFLISGYYGFGNLGDDLILEAILGKIFQKFPRAGVCVLYAEPWHTDYSYRRIKFVYRWNPLGIARAIWKADVVISGGGGLFQDETGKLSLLYYLSIILLARVFSKPVFIWAVGIGPVHRSFYCWLLGRALNMATVCVRDSLSGEALRSFGRPHAIVTADPVFSLGQERIKRTKRICDGLDFCNLRTMGTGPKLGVVLRSENRPEESFWKALRHLRDALGWSVTFLLFHPQKDRQILDPKDHFDKDSCFDLFFPNRPLIIHHDMIASERLHGLYISCLGGIPCMALFPNEKTRGFLEEVSLPVIERTHSVEKMVGAFRGLWRRRKEIQRDLEKARLALGDRSHWTDEAFADVVHQVESRPQV